METTSAWPRSRTLSAVSGILMRFVVTSGMLTCPFSFSVTHEKPARGTHVDIVGILREREKAKARARESRKDGGREGEK